MSEWQVKFSMNVINNPMAIFEEKLGKCDNKKGKHESVCRQTKSFNKHVRLLALLCTEVDIYIL
jgi:hypothetical protein